MESQTLTSAWWATMFAEEQKFSTLSRAICQWPVRRAAKPWRNYQGLRLPNVLLLEQELAVQIAQVNRVKVQLRAKIISSARTRRKQSHHFDVAKTRKHQILQQLRSNAFTRNLLARASKRKHCENCTSCANDQNLALSNGRKQVCACSLSISATEI
jgi:hypothetical protein